MKFINLIIIDKNNYNNYFICKTLILMLLFKYLISIIYKYNYIFE